MPTMWSVLLLCSCICLWLPTPAKGALVISGSSALTQETKGIRSIRSTQKERTDSENVEVFSVRVACTVTSRFAHTVMTSEALNKANSSQEIFFKMELPKTAFITNFSMEIDGQAYVGEVKEKEKAKEQYEKAVSSGQSAGLVKASGRKMEKFSMSVNIAAKSRVTFTLVYEELLQRKLGKYELVTRVKIEQPVQEFQVLTDIYEPQGITTVDATATFLTNDLLHLIEKTVTDTWAHISYTPTVEQQKCPRCENTLINGDFIVTYDVKRDTSLGEVQVVNGYFVHFFSPLDLHRLPKNVVFVIDRSGSMGGRKIQQTREALVSILNDLHEDDHFAIILFDDKVQYWKNSLTAATKTNVLEAIDYVRKLRESGATNINDAVLGAASMLATNMGLKDNAERSAHMIILLTDGMANHGETNAHKIQQNVQAAIGGTMSMYCLGFGNDVDHSFLDVMCKQNKGLARRIFEGSDVVVQLKGFFEEVSSPLLLEVDLHYPDNAVDFLTKNHYSQLFNGSEIVVAGLLKQDDMDNFLLEVDAQGYEDNFRVQGKPSVVNWNTVYPEKEYIFGHFIERLWAYLTIQQLLDKSDTSSQQEKGAITAKALDMSLQYSFVTPLTSMVVTKPDAEDAAGNAFIADKLTEAQRQKAEKLKAPVRRLPSSRQSSSSRGQADVDGDPHFLVELPDRDDALCFNVNDKPGTIFNLVRDPESGFVVNGELIGKKKVVLGGDLNTYFGRFGITHEKLGLRLEVSTEDIAVFYNGKQVNLLWSDTTSLKETNLDLSLTKHCSLTVTLRHSVKFTIIRHTKVWKRRHYHQDYLGFYTLDSHHLSSSVHGLLGQFYRGVKFEVADLRPGEVQEKLDATMYVKGQTLNVTRHWQKNFSKDVKDGENVSCWFVNDDGAGLIDGTASDYTVSHLFEH
ncbi:inter-alpha-trypsin inhibitor heavy chain H3-like [Mugil cephalus]|uniref:inter-alpha-trypsin inhibitor heavy chain H3-like n=1 Tax=Mugil cephalus TaxID=48193 RepID=UPI001FB64749|nr:inter-alpha-trypsin inhibitor heavy chain H3-like [Mugil cephalus]